MGNAKGHEGLTTGLPALDRVLKGVMAGDNIVWRMDNVVDYLAFVRPYCEAAIAQSRHLIYFRFAGHEALLPDDFGAETHVLHPEEGFESFIADVHRVIESAGRGAIYVFDCLSDLVADWYSDQMLGNFFMLTCPYLYDLETVTYFGLLRNEHSSHATSPILQTTQLFLDIYNYQEKLYVRPLKVQYRYSPTIDLLHVWEGNDFTPVTASSVIAAIQTRCWAGLDSDISLGSWERAFLQAEETLGVTCRCETSSDESLELYQRLMRMIISRDEGMLRLLTQYISLEDILAAHKRIVGTGLIGGKTVGMLLARAILREEAPQLDAKMEPHDSFYIGSDVFYTFLVRNGIWWMRQKQRDNATFLDDAGLARQRILAGVFPDYILKQFEEMLDYFGQSPIIVRSSSLLEDNFGNSFAGKYASVFCANQGPRERRLEDFLAAVRTIYASTMSEEALRYRERRGLLDSDEQMALLVMRVSGARYGNRFFPQAAGVGFSFNPYAWSEYIDPKAGVLRLVFGLGTRAVDRSDNDYTRVVALNAPLRRPESNFDEVKQYTQRLVDFLDLTANQVVSEYYDEVVSVDHGLPLHWFTEIVESENYDHHLLTFNHLLTESSFAADMREMLATLQNAYHFPVDIEFTANFFVEDKYSINLLQCRPLPVQGVEVNYLPRPKIAEGALLLEAHGAVIGQSRMVEIERFIYLVPELYGALSPNDRYRISQLLGEANSMPPSSPSSAIMLLGPGRWGTTTPSLGIPVSFNDIKNAGVLCELVMMHENLIPDASLGTHFLNELVEMNILYLALYPGQEKNRVNWECFTQAPNRLLEILPQAGEWQHILRVVDASDLCQTGETVLLSANAQDQEVLCYRTSEAPELE